MTTGENADQPGTVKVMVTYSCHCGKTTKVEGVGDPGKLKQGVLPTMPMAPPRWERTSHVACSMYWEIQFPNEEGECSTKGS